MEKYQENSEEYKILWNKQFTVKFACNAVAYGSNALPSFRLYDYKVAKSIVKLGAQTDNWLIEQIEKEGSKVIGVDTDSSFVTIKEKNLKEEGERLCKLINERMIDFIETYGIKKHFLKLEFDSIYKSLIFSGKRNYAGHCIWKGGKVVDKIVIKGLSAIKSDSTKLSRQIQSKILDMLLKFRAEEEIIDYLKSEIKKIFMHEYNYEMISQPVKLEGNAEEYVYKTGDKAGTPLNLPKLRGVRWSNKFLNTNFTGGTKFYMLWCKHPNDIICFDYEERLKDVNLILDLEKMIEINIFQKLDTIFEVSNKKHILNKLRLETKNILLGQSSLMRFI